MIDAIYDSAEGFANALDRLADQFGDEVGIVVRKSTLDVFTKIVKDTPEETRRASTGWILSADSPSHYLPAELPAGQKYPSPNPEEQSPRAASTGTYWMTNNVDYISVLEDGMPGGSDQAPTGMVANALNAFGQHLNNQLNGMETIE